MIVNVQNISDVDKSANFTAANDTASLLSSGEAKKSNIVLNIGGHNVCFTNVYTKSILEEWIFCLNTLENNSQAFLTEYFEPVAYMYKNDMIADIFWSEVNDKCRSSASDDYIGSVSISRFRREIEEILRGM